MAAAGTSPALNLREKLAELAGLKQRVSPDLVRCDFTNLVTNGDFTTDITGWTDPTDARSTASFQSGKLRVTNAGSGGGFGYAYQSVSGLKSGANHLVKWSVTNPGTLYTTRAYLGSSEGSATYASTAAAVTGEQTLLFTPNATSLLLGLQVFTSTLSISMDFDDVSIWEADPSDDAPWLRLPYGYKVGKRGMIVRDGVILHPSDYTEITDSGQTFIKPIVAPGASTEFSIWAGA